MDAPNIKNPPERVPLLCAIQLTDDEGGGVASQELVDQSLCLCGDLLFQLVSRVT